MRQFGAIEKLYASENAVRFLTANAEFCTPEGARNAGDMNRHMGLFGLRDRVRVSRKQSSFETEVVRLSLIATVSALLLTFSIFQIIDWAADRADLVASQTARARDIADDVRRAIASPDPEKMAWAEDVLRADARTEAGIYYSASGRRVVLRRPGGSTEGLDADGSSQVTARFANGAVVVHVPEYIDGRRVGEMVLRAEDSGVMESLLRNSWVSLVLALLATAASGMIARRLARRALEPLYRLDRGIEAVRRTRDFSHRITVGGDDEFGRLTANFNELVKDIESYDASLHQSMGELTLARDTAESANVMKSQFLANMSHEIRTPLNGVLGMAQAMALHRLDRAQRGRLEVIQQSGGSLLSILNDVLDLAKVEAGRIELDEAPFDAEEIASGACAVFALIAEEKGVGFALAVADDARGGWRGDPVRVRQILCNLVSNAVKFTAAGEVQVEITRTAGPEGDVLQIRVADTGVGISAEDLPTVFEKFTQADSSTTRRFGGTGLGLTICRHMAELMGGAITVESILGQGAVFRVTLPLTKLDAAPSTAPPPMTSIRPAEIAQLRVLAAEDNPTNRLVLKTILNAMGLEPTLVENGQEAVEAWSRERFDLVLMDIQMPVMDGVLATREICRLERERGVDGPPVVAVTANAMKHQVEEYLAAGMVDHLAKPIEIDKLHAVLLRACADRDSQSARAA